MDIYKSKYEKSESNNINRELNYLLIAPRISLVPYPQNLSLHSDLPMIPVGMACVSASMKLVCKNVFNLNLEFEAGDIFDLIKEMIKKHNIDVVLTGGLSGQFSKIKKILDIVKKINDKIITIVGGGVITSLPQTAMRAFELVDIGVVGEGDLTIQELLLAMNADKNIESISGLVIKKNGEYILTKERKEINDLDSLPYPDYVGLGYNKLWGISKTASIVGARSCPFSCTFCFHPSGKKYRVRSINNIIGEIDFLVTNYKISTIGLNDELFVANRKRLIEFCEKIKPYNLSWGCTVHAATFHDDLLLMMKESGCVQICIGIESANDDILMSMNKRTKFAKIEHALELIHSNGIAIEGTLVFGDIAENIASVDKTIEWWRNNRKYLINLVRLITFPGTAVYNYAVKQGIIKDEVAYIKNNSPYVNISKLNEKQYKELSLRLTTEEAFYSNPPPKFSILSVDFQKQTTLVRYECDCGNSDKIWTRGILLSNTVRCMKCNHGFTIPYHKEYSTEIMSEKLKAIISEKGNIAFWGLGREMQLLLKKIDPSILENSYLIDRDPKKQGLTFIGKNINNPSILIKKDIQVVVPTPILGAGVYYLESIESGIAKLCDAKIIPFGDILSQVLVEERIK